MNILRRSFIKSLLNETKIGQNVDFLQLHSLIDNVFLSGGSIELSDDEQDIIDSKTIYVIFTHSCNCRRNLPTFFYF